MKNVQVTLQNKMQLPKRWHYKLSDPLSCPNFQPHELHWKSTEFRKLALEKLVHLLASNKQWNEDV